MFYLVVPKAKQLKADELKTIKENMEDEDYLCGY